MMFLAQLSAMTHTAQVVFAADDESTAQALGPAFADSFWVVAVLAVAVFLLGLDLVRRVRRAKNRAEIQEALAGEVAEMEAAKSAAETSEDK